MTLKDENPPIRDQASRLRDLVSRRNKSVAKLAILSGKGGVGKTSIAVNLSIALSLRSARVTLVDVDLGLANADLLLNVQPRYTLAHVLSGVRALEEVVADGPGGLRFIAGASGFPEWANLSDFERTSLIDQIQTLETSTDIVVLDCGAGISRNVLGFALSADRVMVVTTPQSTAMTDAYAMIKALARKKPTTSVSLLVNMARSRTEAQAVYRRLSDVAKRFLNYPVANDGYLLHDNAVELAVRERSPFVIRYPGANASACISATATQMYQTLTGKELRGGLIKRVAGIFA